MHSASVDSNSLSSSHELGGVVHWARRANVLCQLVDATNVTASCALAAGSRLLRLRVAPVALVRIICRAWTLRGRHEGVRIVAEAVHGAEFHGATKLACAWDALIRVVARAGRAAASICAMRRMNRHAMPHAAFLQFGT